MLIANFSYLNKVQIHIVKEEDKYILTTEHSSMINTYEYDFADELYDGLVDVQYYYHDEYEGNPEEHPSYQLLQDLLEELI